MRRIGIVGTGLMGSHHWWALDALHTAGLTDAVVSSCFDLDTTSSARFSSETGVPVAADLDSLLADCDIVWICTWTAGHLPVVLAAAAADRPVFVEKPMAPSLGECEALASALRGKPHQVGLILRHAPAYVALAAEVTSGRHGRPMGALFRDDQKFPIDGTYGSTWRSDVARAGGGTLIEHSIHDVDVLLWMLGDAESVSAQTTGFAGWPGIEDMAMVRMGFAEGHSAALLSVWHRVEGRTAHRRLEVFCEDAVLWMEGESGPVHIETSAGLEVLETPIPGYLDPLPLDDVPETWRIAAAGLAIQAKAFLDALARGENTGWPTVDDALVAHRVVDAAYRSAAGGGASVDCRG